MSFVALINDAVVTYENQGLIFQLRSGKLDGPVLKIFMHGSREQV